MCFGLYGNTLFQLTVSVKQEISKVFILQSAFGNGLIVSNKQENKAWPIGWPGNLGLRHSLEIWLGVLCLGPLLGTS